MSTKGTKIDAMDIFDVNSVAVALITIIKTSITSLLPNAKNRSCKPIQSERPDSLFF